jgi:hypothetical protein
MSRRGSKSTKALFSGVRLASGGVRPGPNHVVIGG